jgi:hypothetical protein
MALLPNLYDVGECPLPPPKPWNGCPLRIGMFGARRLLKNGVSGAAAAAQLAVRLGVPVELQVSSGRDEGGSTSEIEEIVKGIPNLTLRKMGWLTLPQFRSVLRNVDVHLQPSYTESFNMTVGDAAAVGKGSVVGPAIRWVPKHWMADVDDPSDIARVAEALLHDPKVPEEAHRALKRYEKEALPHWFRFLGIPLEEAEDFGRAFA